MTRWLIALWLACGLVVAGCQSDSDIGQPHLAAVVLTSETPDETAEFYRELGVGLKRFKKAEGAYWAGRFGDLEWVIEQGEPMREALGESTFVVISVGRIDRVLDRLHEAALIPVIVPEKTAWGMRAELRDPDGRRVDLVEKGV